jgi:hypothetical protein
MKLSAKARLPLHIRQYPLPYSCIYIHIFLIKGLSNSLFLALNAKGGEINRPKQKDHTTALFSKNVLQNFACAKTLLTAKGRTFSGGAFI